MRVKLKRVMKDKNISVYLLAKKTGISANNLAKIIKGETSSIKFENIDLICYYLDVNVGDIFEAETPNTDNKNTTLT